MGMPRSNASRSCKKSSTPGFWRPIELTIPAGVSAMRGGGLPARGRGRRLWQHRYGHPTSPRASWRVFRRPGSRGSATGPAELDSEVDTGPLLAHYHAKTSAEKTGPSMQDLM